MLGGSANIQRGSLSLTNLHRRGVSSHSHRNGHICNSLPRPSEAAERTQGGCGSCWRTGPWVSKAELGYETHGRPRAGEAARSPRVWLVLPATESGSRGQSAATHALRLGVGGACAPTHSRKPRVQKPRGRFSLGRSGNLLFPTWKCFGPCSTSPGRPWPSLWAGLWVHWTEDFPGVANELNPAVRQSLGCTRRLCSPVTSCLRSRQPRSPVSASPLFSLLHCP